MFVALINEISLNSVCLDDWFRKSSTSIRLGCSGHGSSGGGRGVLDGFISPANPFEGQFLPLGKFPGARSTIGSTLTSVAKPIVSQEGKL